MGLVWRWVCDADVVWQRCSQKYLLSGPGAGIRICYTLWDERIQTTGHARGGDQEELQGETARHDACAENVS